MKAYPVRFSPIAKERPWGGHGLKAWFQVTAAQPIGEYWVVSGHPDAPSVVANGPLAGRTLTDLTRDHPDAYLGQSPQPRFPLLIKFIEAADDLSVQVHPDDRYALENEGDYGKTEAWYILDHQPQAHVILGHLFSDKEQYLRAVAENRVCDYLRRRRIARDEVVYIPSRTLHALTAGTTLIEIQQTSDVTYRVYDWDRVDEHGNRRELHIEKAADVIQFGQEASEPNGTADRRLLCESDRHRHEHLLTCPYFSLEKLELESGMWESGLGRSGNPDVLIVADGEGVLYGEPGTEPLSLKRGDALLVPATTERYRVETGSRLRLLRTYYWYNR